MGYNRPHETDNPPDRADSPCRLRLSGPGGRGGRRHHDKGGGQSDNLRPQPAGAGQYQLRDRRVRENDAPDKDPAGPAVVQGG